MFQQFVASIFDGSIHSVEKKTLLLYIRVTGCNNNLISVKLFLPDSKKCKQTELISTFYFSPSLTLKCLKSSERS